MTSPTADHDPRADDARFQAAIEGTAAAVEDLLAKTRALRRAGLPTAESTAMAELAQEASFAGEWGAHPVQDVHSFSWLYLLAADDQIASLLVLVRHPATHVYAPVVVGRSVLESCGRAAWLTDPAISARARVARGETDRLYSIHAERRVARGHPAAVAHLDERRDRIVREAERQSFQKMQRKGAALALDEERPGNRRVVEWLFDTEPDLGNILYGHWSGVVHATIGNLGHHLEPVDGRRPTTAGGALVHAAVVARASDALTTLRAVGLGYVQAAKFQHLLFGWGTREWQMTVVNTLRILRPPAGGA